VNLACATRSQAIRRLASLMLLVFCCTVLPAGCGESAVQESNMPPAEFGEKLEKEHPELFVEKTARNKTGTLGGRDKRAIIRREWLAKQQGN
jgi:hypothetical protein